MTSAEAVYLQGVKWVLPLLLCFAGCWSDEPGLHLEVTDGGTGATRIEVYLATRPCSGCNDLLKPQGARSKLPGDVWLLDGTALPTPNTSYAMQDGKVVFALRPPGDVDIDVAFVLAVGYDGAGKVVGVAKLKGVTVPAGNAEVWSIALDAATDQVSSAAPKPEGNRVWVWRRSDSTSSDLAACVGLEESDGKKIERFWFVPEDDTDCDGSDLECDFYNYQAAGTADLSKANCVTDDAPAPNLPATTCLLGGPACVDGHSDQSCGPVDPTYCVPSGLCANPTCAQTLMFPQCVLQNISSHLKVPFLADAALAICQTGGGPQPRVRVDLAALFAGTSGGAKTSCTDVKFFDLGIQNIDPKSELSRDAARFKIEGIAAPCSFDMVWEVGPLSTADVFAGLDITLKNGLHVALPLRIAAQQDGCATPQGEVTLKLLANDTIVNCTRVPDP